MKKYLLQATVLLLMIIAVSFSKSAAPTPRTIAAKDKTTIKEIFKTIGVRNFRMEFGNNESYGSYVLNDQVIKAFRSGSYIDTDLLATGDLYKSYQPGLAFWYYINRSSSEGFEGIFGKANAARLNAVINKYKAANN